MTEVAILESDCVHLNKMQNYRHVFFPYFQQNTAEIPITLVLPLFPKN